MMEKTEKTEKMEKKKEEKTPKAAMLGKAGAKSTEDATKKFVRENGIRAGMWLSEHGGVYGFAAVTSCPASVLALFILRGRAALDEMERQIRETNDTAHGEPSGQDDESHYR